MYDWDSIVSKIVIILVIGLIIGGWIIGNRFYSIINKLSSI
ncbi:hypothetical protein [Clostridium botulinum]|nr:hypothetical protein [Clostridium botulinum]